VKQFADTEGPYQNQKVTVAILFKFGQAQIIIAYAKSIGFIVSFLDSPLELRPFPGQLLGNQVAKLYRMDRLYSLLADIVRFQPSNITDTM